MTQDTELSFGEYRVLRRIGRGGFGQVFLAVNDLFPGHRFAIKAFNTDERDSDAFASLRDELNNLINLSHSNIVQVRGFGIEKGEPTPQPYIVMDYIEGPNGGSYNLKQHAHTYGMRVPSEELKRVFRQVLSALRLVHQKRIAHLDLKPENILIDREGTVFLTDFGVSQTVSSHSLRIHRQANVHGFSPIYAAPEQFRHSYGSRHSDIYSLGVIMMECLTGSRPEYVHSDSLPSVNYDPPSTYGFDQRWDRLFEKCLAIDPAFRYPNADVMSRELEKLPTEQTSTATTPPLPIQTDVTIPSPESTPHPSPNVEPVELSPVGHDPLGEGKISQLLSRTDDPGLVRRDPTPAEVVKEKALGTFSQLLVWIGASLATLVGIGLGYSVGQWVGSVKSGLLASLAGMVLGRELGPWIGPAAGGILGAVLGSAVMGSSGYWVFSRFTKRFSG